MGKTLKVPYKPKSISASFIIAMPKYNAGRHDDFKDTDKERNDLAVSIGENGYSIDQPMKVIELVTDEEKAEAMAELVKQQAFYEGLTPDFIFTPFTPKDGVAPVKYAAPTLREAWNILHVKNGKLIQPTHANVFGYQRCESFPYAIAYLIARYGKEKAVVFDVPCNVMHYESQAERILDCIAENVERNIGLKDATLHWPSLYKMGKAVLEDVYGGTCNESQIQKVIGSNPHRGIMVTKLLVLDKRFPNLGISDRILKAGVNTDGVDLGHKFVEQLDRSKLIALENVTGADPDPVKVAEQNLGNTDEEREASIGDYLAHPDDDKPIKMLTKKGIEDVFSLCSNAKVKYILKAILMGNKFAINKLNALKDTDNAEMKSLGLSHEALPTQ